MLATYSQLKLCLMEFLEERIAAAVRISLVFQAFYISRNNIAGP